LSSSDVRDAVFASPARARSLLTVRAAISFARFSDAPRSSTLSLMCSYWRSRLALLPAGMVATSQVLGVSRGRTR
jgi:hypothetical protein